MSAVIAIAAARPAAGFANVRSMNTEAMARDCCASVHGMTPTMTVLITT